MSSTLLRRMVALGMTVVLSGIAVLPARAAGSVTVTVNGKTVNLAPPTTMQAGRLFVPLRGVFENLGASVVYMNNGQLIGSGGGHRVFLNVGSRQAYVDGQSQMLEVAPFIIGASVFVPLRFVSEALGALVNYDRTNEVVAISGVDASPNRPSAQLPSPPPTPAHSSPSPTVAYSPPPTLSPTLAYSPTPTPSPTPAYSPLPTPSPTPAYSPLPTPSPTPAHSPPPTPLPTLAYSPPPTPSSVEPNTPPQPSGQSRVQLGRVQLGKVQLGNVQPGDGSSTGSRPTVQALFEGGDVDPNSVHVWFDGRDVSISSYISKRGVSYTPQSPILSGRHEVRLQGADLMGASFDQRWQFTSGLEPAAANTILEIVPAPGESVGPKFTVSGRTAPGATVTVQVGQASRGRGLGQFLGGILRVDGHATVQSTVIADQNGRFSSLVDIDAPRGASLGIVITSTDPDHGIAANPIRYSVQVR